jgi:hypothetical protein
VLTNFNRRQTENLSNAERQKRHRERIKNCPKQVTFSGNESNDSNARIDKNRLEENSTSEQSSQVNKIFDVFYKINPTLNWGNKTNRSAAEFLIKKFGLEGTISMSNAAVSIFGKKYAPVVTTPYQLKEKLSQIKSYFESQKSNERKITTL